MRSGGALITIAEPLRVQPEHGGAVFFVVEPDRQTLTVLERRIRDGRLRPAIKTVCALGEAASAFDPARGGGGKTIITVADAG
ncbi:hypothetical protein A5652_21330 [Mycobacterium sp. 1165178.9]|nr:hypothetical protein [Mycobacterium sp. 1165178.9]OBK72557.1 hypothetical protein A5652_21330 [Mycobacterium sp. 1165178.9]